MSFQAVIPSSGLPGWRFLQNTYASQLETFSAGSQISRDSAYFTENISEISSAADLVADPRLLRVALGAFGLEDDQQNKYFIQKILEDGTTDGKALANRLADDRYAQLSEAFGFGPGAIPQTINSSAMAEVVRLNQLQSFEVSVGETDDTLRIALYAQRSLTELADNSSSETAKWYSVMGQTPLRTMFETALGLPSAFSQIDIDQQLEVFQEKTQRLTGDNSVSQFSDPEALERLTTIFIARSQLADGSAGMSSNAMALTLLRS